MAFSKITNEVQPMTMDAAYHYASELVDMERRGTGDTDGALFRIEQRYGLGPNQVMHLASRRAKTCEVGLFARLRAAYLDLCERHARSLLRKIEIEEAAGDDTNSDLAERVRALAAEVAAKKAAAR
jgi:hypothetical protein